MNFISSFLENTHENIDSSYVKEKKEMKKKIRTVGLITTATFLISVIFAIFGIAISTASLWGAIIGLPIILVSLLTSYLSYNGYKISKNINDIINNPKKHQKFLGLKSVFDKQKIKDKLEKDTIFFSWIIELFVEEISKSIHMK